MRTDVAFVCAIVLEARAEMGQVRAVELSMLAALFGMLVEVEREHISMKGTAHYWACSCSLTLQLE